MKTAIMEWSFLIRARDAERSLARIIQPFHHSTLSLNSLTMFRNAGKTYINLNFDADEAQARRYEAKLWKIHGIDDVLFVALNEREETHLN